MKNVLLGATTFFVGFNALAAARPSETGGQTCFFAMDLYGFYVCCLNPSEYICNNHLFKIYIYIYRFQGCVVLVDLDLVMLGLVLLVIMVFIGFFDVCRFG